MSSISRIDLVLDTQPANNVGSPGVNRVIVPVSGGTFDGPKLKGTDDSQKVYMTYRGISYTPQVGPQYWRIAPVFETGAEKYAWLTTSSRSVFIA